MSDDKKERKEKNERKISYNKSQFQKLYQDLAKQHGIHLMNRKNKFYASNWHTWTHKQIGCREWKSQGLKEDSVPLFSISHGSILIYDLYDGDRVLTKKHLDVETDKELLKYLVEEFAVCMAIISNKHEDIKEARKHYLFKFGFHDHDVELVTLTSETSAEGFRDMIVLLKL